MLLTTDHGRVLIVFVCSPDVLTSEVSSYISQRSASFGFYIQFQPPKNGAFVVAMFADVGVDACAVCAQIRDTTTTTLRAAIRYQYLHCEKHN